ncbi:potassium-transporting ATPase KdpC subunit [Rhodococcoides trifolii]|uniref:Potassium-transporting ATPase KdpC subunit n=1 Tax=Rhodococcoides trifolii TaxID=908250 RepID=A0A917FVZ7_9NOCA|nr:potassium-transporting ATPase subunit C [Rhodococcus trifolii]GGG06627.1 potassium-transporting ATPase KdpC subunit [Rhodococcus trifolii]
MRTFSVFFKQIVAGFAVLLALTAVLGVAYPAAVWAVSRIGSHSAEGSPLTDANGCVVGSSLLGVDTAVGDGPDPYFHARVTGSVSAEDPFAPGDPSASLPLNQGPSSDTLASFVEQRRAAVAARENVDPAAVPVDAVTGSGSGVDPDISPEYAAIQIPRVAAATGRSQDEVRALVSNNTDGRQLGFLGQPTVNVTTLNVDLGLTAPDCSTSGG